MRISIRAEDTNYSNKIKVPTHLGLTEELFVKDYLNEPTQAKRDYIVAFCDRFILYFFKKFKIPDDYDDFHNEGVIKVLEVLKKFDPEKGSFIGWVMKCLEGFSRTYRYNRKRYLKTQLCKGLSPIDTESNVFAKCQDYFINLEDGMIRQLDKGTVHAVLDQLVVRFCTQPELALCKGNLDFLKEHGRFPTFKENHDKYSVKLKMNIDDLYFFHQYFKIVCHLHFLKYWKEQDGI